MKIIGHEKKIDKVKLKNGNVVNIIHNITHVEMDKPKERNDIDEENNIVYPIYDIEKSKCI